MLLGLSWTRFQNESQLSTDITQPRTIFSRSVFNGLKTNNDNVILTTLYENNSDDYNLCKIFVIFIILIIFSSCFQLFILFVYLFVGFSSYVVCL